MLIFLLLLLIIPVMLFLMGVILFKHSEKTLKATLIPLVMIKTSIITGLMIAFNYTHVI